MSSKILDEPGLYQVQTDTSSKKGLVGLYDHRSQSILISAQFGKIGEKLNDSLRVVVGKEGRSGVWDLTKKATIVTTCHSEILGLEGDMIVATNSYLGALVYFFYSDGFVIVVGRERHVNNLKKNDLNWALNRRVIGYSAGYGVHVEPEVIKVVGDQLIVEWVYTEQYAKSKLLCISLKSGELVTGKDWTQK